MIVAAAKLSLAKPKLGIGEQAIDEWAILDNAVNCNLRLFTDDWKYIDWAGVNQIFIQIQTPEVEH